MNVDHLSDPSLANHFKTENSKSGRAIVAILENLAKDDCADLFSAGTSLYLLYIELVSDIKFNVGRSGCVSVKEVGQELLEVHYTKPNIQQHEKQEHLICSSEQLQTAVYACLFRLKSESYDAA